MRNLLALLAFICTPALALNVGPCDGVTNLTPAWNAAVDTLKASLTDKTITFSAGQCLFNSQPVPLEDGVSVVGQGKSATLLIRNYSGTFITVYGQGTHIRDLTVYAAAGTSGGVGLHAVSSNLIGPGGNHVFSHLWITGNGTYSYTLYLEGWQRTIAPIGMRTVFMLDVTLFNATSWAAQWWGCVGCEWFGGGVYQGFGTTQAIAVGGPMSEKNYINAHIDWAVSTVYPESMRASTQ